MKAYVKWKDQKTKVKILQKRIYSLNIEGSDQQECYKKMYKKMFPDLKGAPEPRRRKQTTQKANQIKQKNMLQYAPISEF